MMNINDLMGEKIAIHCETEEQSKVLMEILKTHGCRTLPFSFWSIYKEKTCYNLSRYKNTEYSDKEFYIDERWEVIKFEHIINESY